MNFGPQGIRMIAALALAVALCAATAPARNAPDFTLTTPDGKQVSLSALRGKLVVVEFMSPT